jgi:L-amino acid N-acyltransferase YncA
MNHIIEPMKRDDWIAVRTIYGEGLATGLAAFMKNPARWNVWNARYLNPGRLVARQGGAVVGWAAMSPVPDN